METFNDVNAVDVWFKAEHVGTLSQEGVSKFVFRYDDDSPYEISKTMPRSEKEFVSSDIHPIFQMNIPEGELFEAIKNKLRREGELISRLGLLSFAGSKQVGCFNYSTVGGDGINLFAVEDPVSFSEINESDNEFEAFDKLMLSHLRSGVSGAQPKFLSAMQEEIPKDKMTFKTSEYVIKTYDADKYPCLTVVEDLSMKLAKLSNINVADTFLSRQGNVLFVKRFDVKDSVTHGEFPFERFEEACSLMGKGTESKYTGSYEDIVGIMNQLGKNKGDMEAFYRQFVFNCMVRNGDAHLKNFGFLLDDAGDAKLSPAYDIVSTGVWFPREKMALSANKQKTWPTNSVMLKFGFQVLGLKKNDAKQIIEDVRSSIFKYKDTMISEYREKYKNLAYIKEAMDNMSTKIDVGTGITKEKYATYFNFEKELSENKNKRQYKSEYQKIR